MYCKKLHFVFQSYLKRFWTISIEKLMNSVKLMFPLIGHFRIWRLFYRKPEIKETTANGNIVSTLI